MIFCFYIFVLRAVCYRNTLFLFSFREEYFKSINLAVSVLQHDNYVPTLIYDINIIVCSMHHL